MFGFNFNLGSFPSKSSKPRWNDGPNDRAVDRNVLRKGFGNMAYKTTKGDIFTGWYWENAVGHSQTPFRVAMNAGDIFGTTNKNVSEYALPKPANQVHVKNMSGWKVSAGKVKLSSADDDATDIASFYSGNPKYVYDSSDYVRFKKLQAKNRNYNDSTFGGDQHHASQVAIRSIRR
jgi:hypothetical protein